MQNEEMLPVEITSNAIAPIADDAIIRIAEKAEKMLKAMEVIIKFCIQRTSSLDWVDESGKPFLQASGAQKIGLPLGINWKIHKVTWEDIGEGHRNYEAQGIFTFQGNSIEEFGTRSSKDAFFTRGGKIPASEVDMNDVKKASITNCIGRGISALLGLRNMTWQQLEAYGLKKDGITKVDYQKTAKEESSEAKDNRAEIRRMILEMSGGRDADAKAMLQEITSFIPKGKTEKDRVKGKASVAELSEAAVNVTYGKVKTIYEKFIADGKGKQDANQDEGITPDDVFMNCEAGIPLCETIEDVVSIISYAETQGVTGDNLTKLRRQADKRKTDLREGQK